MLKISDFFLNTKKDCLLSIGYFALETSEVVNLVGNNSSGKSLLIKSIHGDYYNFSGDIIIKEKPAIFYKKRKQTVLVEKRSHLLMDETVWRNIILPFPKFSSRLKLKVSELCIVAGIDNILQEKVRNISYSEQKFIELIRAVAQLPYIVLVDDFDSYFDEVNISKALEILDFASSSGSSVILSSKNKIQGCNRSMKLQNGALVEI